MDFNRIHVVHRIVKMTFEIFARTMHSTLDFALPFCCWCRLFVKIMINIRTLPSLIQFFEILNVHQTSSWLWKCSINRHFHRCYGYLFVIFFFKIYDEIITNNIVWASRVPCCGWLWYSLLVADNKWTIHSTPAGTHRCLNSIFTRL